MDKSEVPRCTGHRKGGRPCLGWRVRGSDKCRMHIGQGLARAQVRAEVMDWGPGDKHVDPGEVLLRLVSQSAARVARYSSMLEEAYDAAERLKQAHIAHGLIDDDALDDGTGDLDSVPVAVAQAHEDLSRVFSEGGLSTLIGNTYALSNSGRLYATGEAIRGLAQLEATERDRCANFCAKAIAAGLAERQVRLAERSGAMMAVVLGKVLARLGLDEAQRQMVPELIRAEIELVDVAPK